MRRVSCEVCRGATRASEAGTCRVRRTTCRATRQYVCEVVRCVGVRRGAVKREGIGRVGRLVEVHGNMCEVHGNT